MGLPDLPATRFQAASAAAGAIVTGFVGVSLAQLVLGAPLLPRAVMGGIAASYVPWALICWHAEHDRLRRSTLRALFIGAEQEYAELLSELVNERIPVELVAGVTATDDDRRTEVAGDLRQRISDDEIDLVVLDMASLAHHGIVSAIADAHREGVRVRTVSLFAEEFLGKIPVADLERMSLLFDIGELHRVRYMRWKRVIDIAFGLAALVVLVPMTVVVVVGNLVANQGPLLYRQMRIGKDGEEFEILKFRTMSRSEDSEGEWTVADDPRITPFGSLLRRSHLDELPQAWNVMRGDLSIVGPLSGAAPLRADAQREDPLLRHATPHPALADRVGAGQLPLRFRRDRCSGEAAVRPLPSPAAVAETGCSDPRSHAENGRGKDGSMSEHALATVVIPARNEEADLPRALASLAHQTVSPDRIEVVVVDGDSTDRTAEIARHHLESMDLARFAVLNNPGGNTPSNLNRGLEWALGEFIVRIDARSEVPNDYIERTTALLRQRPEVAVTGGSQEARERSTRCLDRAIAAALNNPIAMGGSRYRRNAESGIADTVYLGVFRRSDLLAIGGWDEHFSSNQDFELNQRILQRGVVWFEAGLPVGYLPRTTLRGLFEQYHRFGRWKTHYWLWSRRPPRLRQLVLLILPPLGVIGCGVVSRFGRVRRLVVPTAGFSLATVGYRSGLVGLIAWFINVAIAVSWWTGVVRGFVKDDVR